MPDIDIERNHTLGLPAARAVARQWMQRAEQDYGMECSYAEGEACDVAQFGRAGVDGNVEVSADNIKLRATLAFPFNSLSEQIEQRLRENLDELLGAPSAGDSARNEKDWL